MTIYDGEGGMIVTQTEAVGGEMIAETSDIAIISMEQENGSMTLQFDIAADSSEYNLSFQVLPGSFEYR